MRVKVEQARWNHEKQSWDPPGTIIEIDQADYPYYAAHCSIIDNSPPAGAVPDDPGASITERSATAPSSGAKKKPAPKKKPIRRKK